MGAKRPKSIVLINLTLGIYKSLAEGPGVARGKKNVRKKFDYDFF